MGGLILCVRVGYRRRFDHRFEAKLQGFFLGCANHPIHRLACTYPQKVGSQPPIAECRRQADALDLPPQQTLQPMQQGLQLSPAFVADKSMQLVDHHRFQRIEDAF